MIANAIVDAAAVAAIACALARVLDGGLAIAAMILSTLINALPYGYDNAVLGFNTHYYLLLAFSLASVWFLADGRAWSLRWAAGVLCGVCSFLCMASGALTLAAAAGAHLLQIACGRRAGLREWLGIAALAALTVALIGLIPHVPEADEFRAHSFGQFLSAVLALMSWPAHTSLGSFLVLPSALFFLRTLEDRPALSDPCWFNIMALVWILSQMVALAVGRALIPLQSRYFDILLVGLSISLVSAFWLFQRNAVLGKPTIWRSLALGAWLGFLALSLTHPQRHLPDKIEEWRMITAAGAENVRQYLATGNTSYILRTPGVEVPTFFPERLRELLDMPEIRSTLSPALTSREAPHLWVEVFKRGFLRLSYVWLGVGALMLAAVLARAEMMRRRPVAQDCPSGGSARIASWQSRPRHG
ncbi:MAG: hypothetical protein JO160_05900 [Candidatus Eremiobacteraeota bacterium]|nr:hypothetical protein [Candidatus Eremiobacteraeota bacterium]